MSRHADIYRRIMINARRTLRGSGDVVADALVSCPRQTGTVPLENCARCGECDAFFFDGTNPGSFIVCRAMPTPEELTNTEPDSERLRVNVSTDTPIREIMSKDVVCVRADLSLATAMELFVARGISGAPIVDDEGRPVGLISKTDIIRDFVERDENSTAGTRPRRLVADVMTPIIVAVEEDAPVTRAAALMASRHLHRVPVLSAEGIIVGIVSSLDVMRWVAQENQYLIPAPEQF